MFLLLFVLMMSSCGIIDENSKSLGGGSGDCNSGCCGSGCPSIDPFIDVTDEMCISGDGYVNVSWTNPIIYPLPDMILVLRKTNDLIGPQGQGSNPAHPLDPFAETIYFGPPTNFIQDTDVMNHTWYHYGIWWANQIGIDDNGEPIYEYSANGAFCQAFPCAPGNTDDGVDPIDDPVIITPGDGAICLDWQLPEDEDVIGVRVYRSNMPFVGEPKDDPNAEIIFEGTGTELVDAQVINDQPYYYAIYTVGENGQISDTAVSVSETPTSILPTPEEVTKFTASDAMIDDDFGHAVDIKGDLMVVGAFDAGNGKVYIYNREQNSPLTADDDVWTESQIITDSAVAFEGGFGEEVFISNDQDLIIVGAPYDDVNGEIEAGAVYLYERNALSGQWERTQRLVASNAFDYDRLGAELEYSKDEFGNEVLAIGASYANTGSIFNTGRVYLFEKVAGVWTETAIIESPSTTEDFFFGSEIESADAKVAVSGDDQVFILEKLAGTWTVTQTITGSDTVAGDNFGHEISIDGNMMIISANNANISINGSSYTDAGEVYVFVKDPNGVWVELAKIDNPSPQNNDSFGEDVDLSGNLLVVGSDQYASPSGSYGSESTGKIDIFRFDDNQWQHLGTQYMSDAQNFDKAGVEVRINGTTLIVGANFEDGGEGSNLPNAGAAYVFDITAIVNLCVAPGNIGGNTGGTIVTVPPVSSTVPQQTMFDSVLGTSDQADVIDISGDITNRATVNKQMK